MFAPGVVFLILGIATGNAAFIAVGIIFMFVLDD
jgi:hypothetical protein